MESDLSAFHRVDSFDDIDAPRFFRLLGQLPRYAGALQAALVQQQTKDSPPTADAWAPGGPTEIQDVRLLAELTNQDGMAGIEYNGG